VNIQLEFSFYLLVQFSLPPGIDLLICRKDGVPILAHSGSSLDVLPGNMVITPGSRRFATALFWYNEFAVAWVVRSIDFSEASLPEETMWVIRNEPRDQYLALVGFIDY
jgi:hypothetical protein